METGKYFLHTPSSFEMSQTLSLPHLYKKRQYPGNNIHFQAKTLKSQVSQSVQTAARAQASFLRRRSSVSTTTLPGPPDHATSTARTEARSKR